MRVLPAIMSHFLIGPISTIPESRPSLPRNLYYWLEKSSQEVPFVLIYEIVSARLSDAGSFAGLYLLFAAAFRLSHYV